MIHFHPAVHNTGGPLCGAGISIVTGFDLHNALGITGQIVGIIAGLLSIAWACYQFYQARKGKPTE